MSYVEYRSLKVSPQDSLDDLKALSELCRETRKAVVNSQHAARWEFMYRSAAVRVFVALCGLPSSLESSRVNLTAYLTPPQSNLRRTFSPQVAAAAVAAHASGQTQAVVPAVGWQLLATGRSVGQLH